MERTNVTLDCYGTSPTPSTEDFRIEASVTSAGELPTSAIFVFNIGDPEDTGADSFARVANPQDLQNLSVDRDIAIGADSSEFLATYASFQYSDLEVAVSAKAMIKGRINDLIHRWITYQDAFILDSGVSSSYPSSDPAAEVALQNTYTDARDDRIVAEAAVATADTALTDAKSALDSAQELITLYTAQRDFIVSFSVYFNAYVDAVLAEGFEGSTAEGIRTGTLVPALSTQGNLSTSNVQLWVNNRTTYETALATATQGKIEAGQTLSAAQAAEDAALAAIIAICPDFDPTSV